MATNQKLITFVSQALGDEDLLVTRVTGVEGMSRLFRFEVECVSQRPNVDLGAVLANTATLGIKQGVQLAGSSRRGTRTIQIHGIVCEIEQGEKRTDWATYRLVFVPRMWNLTRTHVSQVYLEVDVPTVIAQNLQDAGLQEGEDFEFRLASDYPVRESIVQYEESDFDFISRWMAHEGIFWFFEHTESGDKIVFGDDPSDYRPISGHPVLNYRPEASAAGGGARAEVRDSDDADDDWFAEEVISSLRCRQQTIPKKVTLKDYNWRNPRDPLTASVDINRVLDRSDDAGHGHRFEYNNHYKNDSEGGHLAQIRAGELIADETAFTGSSDCRSFRAGATFQLADHYRRDFNIELLLTEVHHEATQTVSLATSASVGATYENRFRAIPSARTYRPARTTPWPRITGLMHATVESLNDEGTPLINKFGQYRVRLPFDIANEDKGKGQASRWIRLATPNAGAGYGTHSPLRGGTEVILSHIDGDPDRPIIVGAVPNALNMSMVTNGNVHQHVTQTSDGSRIVMEDDSQGIVMFNGGANSVSAFRGNGGAGQMVGAGYAPPPAARRPMLPPLDSSPSAVGGGFLGGAMSSRVGMFSGPLSQLHMDGGALIPALMHRSPADGGGDSSDENIAPGWNMSGGDSSDSSGSHDTHDPNNQPNDPPNNQQGPPNNQQNPPNNQQNDPGPTVVEEHHHHHHQTVEEHHHHHQTVEQTTIEQTVVNQVVGDENQDGQEFYDGARTQSAEDVFFNSHGTRANLDTAFVWAGKTAAPYDTATTPPAGLDFRSEAGRFEASKHKIEYVSGNSIAVYDVGSDGGNTRGTYQKGGDQVDVFDSPSGVLYTHIRADETCEDIEINGGNLTLHVKQADTGGDQVWGPGASECVAFQRQYNVTDATVTAPYAVDSSALADGTLKEVTKAKVIDELTEALTGEGRITGWTKARVMDDHIECDTNLVETVWCKGGAHASSTNALCVAEHQAAAFHFGHEVGGVSITSAEALVNLDIYGGTLFELFFGIHFQFGLGIDIEIATGGQLEAFIGDGVELHLGDKAELHVGHVLECHVGGTTEVNTTAEFVNAIKQDWIAPMASITSGVVKMGTP